MANIKSAKKRIKITARRTLRNKMIKSRTHTEIKKVIIAIDNKNLEQATSALRVAYKIIDKAKTKGVYHKNNAARKKSRLARLVNNLKKG